jgi:Rha family phage regulatory protein
MSDNMPETIHIVKDEDGVARVSSLVVADKFDKRHADVLRAIDNLLEDATCERRNFAFLSRVGPRGQSLREVEMTKRGFSLLAMGFTGRGAMEWKSAFLDAFEMMERELTRRQPAAINVRDQGQLAEIATQLLQLTSELKEEVAELKPDAESMRLLRTGEGSMTLTAVAKMLEVKRNWLFDLLTEAGWLYWQNGARLPYAPLMKQGLLTVDPAKGKPILRSSGAVEVKVTTLVTAKGLAKVTELVKAKLAEGEE